MNAPTTLEQVPLTRLQTGIFVSQGVAAYRLPFVYHVDASETAASLTRRLRAAVAAAPGLSCRYGHDPATGAFTQWFDPALAGAVTVVERGEVAGPVEALCADPAAQPDLRTGPALTASVATVDGRRVLVVEFHHIAVDGPGAALVEALLLSPTPPEPRDPAAVLDAYAAVASAEATHAHTRCAGVLPVSQARPDVRRDDALVRVSRRVATGDVRAVARALRTFPRVAVQAALEQWLAAETSGAEYAWVSSWRWTLGLQDVVANVPVLLARRVHDDETLAATAARLLVETGDPEVSPADTVADAPRVVFSWEDFGDQHGRYVPVDRHPRFALYVRVVAGPRDTDLHVELDRRLVDEATATRLLDHLVTALTPAPTVRTVAARTTEEDS